MSFIKKNIKEIFDQGSSDCKAGAVWRPNPVGGMRACREASSHNAAGVWSCGAVTRRTGLMIRLGDRETAVASTQRWEARRRIAQAQKAQGTTGSERLPVSLTGGVRYACESSMLRDRGELVGSTPRKPVRGIMCLHRVTMACGSVHIRHRVRRLTATSELHRAARLQRIKRSVRLTREAVRQPVQRTGAWQVSHVFQTPQCGSDAQVGPAEAKVQVAGTGSQGPSCDRVDYSVEMHGTKEQTERGNVLN